MEVYRSKKSLYIRKASDGLVGSPCPNSNPELFSDGEVVSLTYNSAICLWNLNLWINKFVTSVSEICVKKFFKSIVKKVDGLALRCLETFVILEIVFLVDWRYGISLSDNNLDRNEFNNFCDFFYPRICITIIYC